MQRRVERVKHKPDLLANLEVRDSLLDPVGRTTRTINAGNTPTIYVKTTQTLNARIAQTTIYVKTTQTINAKTTQPLNARITQTIYVKTTHTINADTTTTR